MPRSLHSSYEGLAPPLHILELQNLLINHLCVLLERVAAGEFAGVIAGGKPLGALGR